MPTKTKAAPASLHAVPAAPIPLPDESHVEANVRALHALEKHRKAVSFGKAEAGSLLEVLAEASGTSEVDLVVGLLQEVRETLAMVGTAVDSLDLMDMAPLLELDDFSNTFATLRRKLVAVERLYLMKVSALTSHEDGETSEVAP